MFRSLAAVASTVLACAFAAAAFAQTSAPAASPPPPLMPITLAGDAARGAVIGQTCAGCHGIPGYYNAQPAYHVPKLGGQNADYVEVALQGYRRGTRGHETMHAQASSLSDQDIADVAAFYSQHGPEGGAAPDKPAVEPSPPVAALLQKGVCNSCHGPNYTKPIDGGYPKIAGQYADYLYAALKAYQTDKNPHVGRGNAIMAAQVKQFSHAELRSLADYIGSLPGELRTVRESAFK